MDFITHTVSKACLDHVHCNQPQRIKLVTSQNIGLADQLPIVVGRKYVRLNRKEDSIAYKIRKQKHFKLLFPCLESKLVHCFLSL